MNDLDANMDTTTSILSSALDVSMLPPPTETRRYTKQEWEVHRQMIESQCSKLKHKEILELLRERNFHVNVKQLKDRMNTWGLGKNIRKSEMKAIVRKQKQREAQGKCSSFKVRDNVVAGANIVRWQKRQKPNLSVDEMEIDEPASTPSAIDCDTPRAPASLSPSPSPQFSTLNNLSIQGQIQTISMGSSHKYAAVDHSMHNGMLKLSTSDNASDIARFLRDQCGMLYLSTAVKFTIPKISDLDDILSSDSVESYPQHQSYNTDMILASDIQHLSSGTAPLHYPQRGESHHPGNDYNQKTTRASKKYREDEEIQFWSQLEQHQNDHGPTHYLTLITAKILLQIYKDRRELRSANILCKQIIRNCFVSAGENDRGTLLSLVNLSTILRFQAHFKQADTLSSLVYLQSQTFLPSTDTAHFEIRNALASCHFALGLNTQAEELFRENIRHGSSVLPPNNYGLLFAMSQVARLLRYRCEYTEAEKIARSILTALSLDNHPLDMQVLGLRIEIGELMSLQNYSEAETSLRSVLQDCEEALGQDHSWKYQVLEYLARCLYHQNRHDEAMLLLKDAIRRSTAFNGPESLSTLNLEITLSETFMEQKQFVEAENLLNRISGLLQKAHEDNREDIDRVSWQLGVCYHGQNRLEEAAAILEKTLQIVRERERCHPKQWLVVRSLERVRQDRQHRDASMPIIYEIDQ